MRPVSPSLDFLHVRVWGAGRRGPVRPGRWRLLGPFGSFSNVERAWPVGEFNQWTPHGLGEQSGKLVDGGRLLDGPVGEDEFIGVADDQADPQAPLRHREEV